MSDPYNVEVVVSKECLGHAQKPLKKQLVKSSSLFNKVLPESKARRIAHLYALVVVQKKYKEATTIRNALKVLFEHTREEKHNCPPGESSWGYHQKKAAAYTKDSTLPAPYTRFPYLTQIEKQRARQVFDTFASLEFYCSMTIGKTQNSNKSLHSMIWQHSPKTKRVGEKSLIASTAMAVLSHNDGSLAFAMLFKKLGMDASHRAL